MNQIEHWPNVPKVTLLTWTQNPLGTVWSVWEASKTEMPIIPPDEIEETVSQEALEKLFRAVIAQRIPIGEHIDFIFMIENISISWREQAVRHRIGTKISPELLGIDIVPDLAESSFWSQSMRIQNMGRFATEKKYRLPESIANGPAELEREYHNLMRNIELVYNLLVDHGVPMEDARELIPLGAQHRISWKLNIGSLQHIIGKRGCWILQLGIWGPVITGMVNELATKVHPIFRELVCPPCIHGDDFNACIYEEECRRRLDGEDELPPCPLHLCHHKLKLREGIGPDARDQAIISRNIPMTEEMYERAEQYQIFWGRDPFTGRKIGW
jgi:thymidylate synthase ThyX